MSTIGHILPSNTASLIVSFLLGGILSLNAQPSYNADSAKISFYSYAPIEEITATSHKAESTLNLNDGTVSARVSITSFIFKKQLMQKHFNEQYMESESFPHASFDGKLRDELIQLPDYPQVLKTRVQGELTIKGVTQKLDEEVTLTRKDGSVIAICSFKVKLSDYNIKIPRMLIKNIAEEVDVRLEFSY